MLICSILNFEQMNIRTNEYMNFESELRTYFTICFIALALPLSKVIV